MLRLALPVILLAAAVAAVLVTRGGNVPREVRARDGRIAISMHDFRFRPQIVRAAPGTLTIELRNEGRLGHGFRLRKNGRMWIEERSLRPGERRTVRRRLERGDYRMFDALSNFEQLGMYGTLVVR